MFALKQTKALVVGDVMLDRYDIGTVSRISPEAPVPVLLKERDRSVLGGAANVAANMCAAGQDVWIMSVTGEDQNGLVLESMLREKGIHTEYVIQSPCRHTIQKTRFVTKDGQQLLRMDEEDICDISNDEVERLIGQVREGISSFDVIVMSDYLKGTLIEGLAQKIIELARDSYIPVLIDIKDRNTDKYKGAYLLKPNRFELNAITGLPVDTIDEVVTAGKNLLGKCYARYVLVTVGIEGMILIGDMDNQGIKVKFYPSIEAEVYDVSGAGDTALAYLGYGIASGYGIDKSVNIANMAASIQVSKKGTSIVYLDEVEKKLNGGLIQIAERKELELADLAVLRKRKMGKKIIFTNGCFDILHVGHIRYLQEASKLGDILVVGINSDDSVKRLKGERRPINTVQDRSEMLAAYSFIDYIVVFDDDTPINLIQALQPDYLVKGADYQNIKNVVGADIVVSYGGQVVLIDFVEGKSTTNIINKLNQENCKWV